MSVYPYALDDDITIIRVDDNISEVSGQNFNQVRDAIFKIEMELGIKPAGTKNNLKEFLDVAHNQDGSIKASALSSVGLVTLPIDNADVGVSAGIVESKLSLNYSTNTLKLLIEANANQISTISAATDAAIVKVNRHIGGGPGSAYRHVLSHIDVNSIPTDSRDISFTWDGLKDTTGGVRSATNLGEALDQINDELVDHQLAADPVFGHTASGISVDATNFSEIPGDVNNVQEAIEAIDELESTAIGIHRAIMHSPGVPAEQRSSLVDSDGYNFDGYGSSIVTNRQAYTYLATTGGVVPVDSTVNGDDVIQFAVPDAAADKYQLDSEFVLVKPGDIARINYGNGLEATHIVESTRFVPGTQWAFRINGNNLLNTEDAYVRIDRPLFDKEVWGIAAVAASNAYPTSSFSGFYGSVIAASPRGAVALGVGFDPNQIDSSHYLLYLQMYPDGNPLNKVVDLPGIDVTGNAGATPGDYTLESIVQATNNGLRAAGVNARFIAFGYEGNFGIMMADAINGASFSIVTGSRSGSSVIEGSYVNNVIDDVSTPEQDALGLGANGSDFASPAYSSDDFADSVIALKPTKILMPRKRRYYVADGSRRDFMLSAPDSDNTQVVDGYWMATITDRISLPGVTAKTEYTINKDLSAARLFPGKTITVQPTVDFDDTLYTDADYGRFIIDSVQYIPPCPGDSCQTIITVINGVHASTTSDPEGASTDGTAGLQVEIYFDNTSVGFNQNNMVDLSGSTAYHRLHEIYATSGSETFSHERLRMPVQSVGTPYLGTANWRVRGASPKLQGFTDNSTSLDRWVRFYILDYDSTSGVFDGYIGRRSESNNDIFDYGPIVTGSKNTSVRFYDNTGVDYIEVEYLESATSATTILAPSYVDIQVFPSLELDNEVTLLATCEVNWTTPSTQMIERVVDRRQIGSVSDTEFTQSAKEFISAADKYLHVNGVVRGFESFGEDESDSSAIVLGGGTAIINGAVVNSNAGKVRIPQLVPTGGGAGSSLDWAICVNEEGNFVQIPLTSTKQHFFAEAGTGGGTPYFIPSATFLELIYERKDLLLLFVVNVTINSVTINSISDFRKFSLNESAGINLSISDDSKYASFTSFDQVINWATKNTDDMVLVKVKGNVTIDTAVDLTGITSKLILEGDGGIITVNSSIGFIVQSNVQFRNLKIIYNHVLTLYDSSDLCHLSNEASCIKFTAGASDCRVERCEFSHGTTGERNPYIGIFSTINPSADIENIFIEENTFHVSNNTYNCAVGFYQTGSSASSHTLTLLKNIGVNRNIIDGYQSIIVTSEDEEDSFRTELFEIDRNSGQFVIGVVAKEKDIVSVGVASNQYYKNIKITNNEFSVLFSAGSDGKFADGYSDATMYIANNNCFQVAIDSGYMILYLLNNVIEHDFNLEQISTQLGIDETIKVNLVGSIQLNIHNNNINVYSNGTGIWTNSGHGHITNNYIWRSSSVNILSYINAENVLSTINLMIVDNILSDASVSPGISNWEDAIKSQPEHTVDRNINHLNEMAVDFGVGVFGAKVPLLTYTQAITNDLTISDISSWIHSAKWMEVDFNATSLANGFAWRIPLENILPNSAKIYQFSVTASWYSASGTMSNVVCRAYLRRSSDETVDIADSGTIACTVESTDYSVITNCSNTHVKDSYIYVFITPNYGGGSSDAGTVYLKNPTIKWKY